MPNIHKARSRNFFIRTYLKPEEFEPITKAAKNWAYILHDKDGGEPHYHIIAVFKNARTEDGIRATIPSEQQTRIEIIKNGIEACYRYLTHEDNPEKHHYSKDEIQSNEKGYFEEDKAENETAEQMLDDILQGLTLRELARRYGRDFMKNWRKYTEFAYNVMIQEDGNKLFYERMKELHEFAKVIQMRGNGQFEIISKKPLTNENNSDKM